MVLLHKVLQRLSAADIRVQTAPLVLRYNASAAGPVTSPGLEKIRQSDRYLMIYIIGSVQCRDAPEGSAVCRLYRVIPADSLRVSSMPIPINRIVAFGADRDAPEGSAVCRLYRITPADNIRG